MPAPDQIMDKQVFTTDTDFASALMAKGAKLVSWKPDPRDVAGRKMQWFLEGVRGEWVAEYHGGSDGFFSFIHAKRMLVNIAKTDDRITRR
jgi:hypothetical protein